MIEGLRIKLKAFESDDIDFMLSLLNDFETSYFEGKNEFLVSRDEQINWLKNRNKNNINYIIVDNKNNRIGYVSFKFINNISKVGKIGIKLHKDFRGKGFASDTLKTICSYLFLVFNVHKLETHIIEYNKSSLCLFEKSGWSIEGRLRKTIFMSGRYYDNILWGILKDEFLSNEHNKQHINLFFGEK